MGQEAGSCSRPGSGRRLATASPRAGATPEPQLPPISVVTPCRILLSMRGLSRMERSEWVWMSIYPGVT